LQNGLTQSLTEWLAALRERQRALQNGPTSGPGPTVAAALARAETQFDLIQASKAVGATRPDVAPTDTATVQAVTLARLALELCRAELALALAGEVSSEKGPKGQSLAEWLAILRERQRTLKALSEMETGEMEDSLVGQGTPYRGRLTGAGLPVLAIVFRSEVEPRASMVPWLGVLAGLTLLALLPVIWPVLRPLWPEQLAVLAVIGWIAAGPTPMVLLLLLAWFAGRLVGIVHLLLRLRRGARFQRV
jgi:hypothetical protein